MSLRPRLLTLLAACLLSAFASLPAQAQDEPRESSLARARVAAALRDSLLRLDPDIDDALQTANVPRADITALAAFLRDPFDATVSAPSLDQLDVSLARVNAALRKSAKDIGVVRQNAPEMAGESPGVGKLGGGLLGGLGLPSEAQLLVGLTDFMVERVKDDVAFGFVLTLRNSIRDDTWIRVGLPSSYQLMQRMDDNTYSTFMPVLRSAFVEDLNTLPGRAYLLADSLGRGGNANYYLRGLAIAYERGIEIRQGSPPAAALANLAGITAAQMPDSVTRRALVVVGLAAREYAAAGGEQLAREIAREDRGWLRRYLVGFLARDLVATENLPLGNARTRLLQFMAAREPDVVILVNQLDATRAVLQDVQRTAQAAVADVQEAAREAEDASREAQNALDRALASAGAVLQVMSTGQRFLYWGDAPEPASVGMFREFVTDANTLHQAFIKRDYASLVNWAVQRPELSVCLDAVASAGALRDQAAAAAVRQVQSERAVGVTGPPTPAEQVRVDALVQLGLAAQAAKAAPGEQPGRCRLRTQYLAFAASLSAARSAEEVTVALRQAAAPVGSYRAKRNQYSPEGDSDRRGRRGPWSATFGGYLGATGGWEEGGTHFGPALPVGMEVSYGLPLGAVSFFVPVIDIGTLASARFDGDDKNADEGGESGEGEGGLDESGPTFRQVLAPGAFVVLNLSRSLPISVGAGWQAVPDLRERDGERVTVGRFSIFVGADVSLLNFRF